MSKTRTMRAVHTIKLPDQTIQAGTTFACPVEYVKELTESGAISHPKALIPSEAGQAAPAAPAPAAPAAPAPAAPAASPKDALKAARAKANSLGINVRTNWKLATLEKKIKAVEENGDIL